MDHDSICVDGTFVPYSFVDLFCRENSSRIADEKEKDLEFNGSHFYILPSALTSTVSSLTSSPPTWWIFGFSFCPEFNRSKKR